MSDIDLFGSVLPLILLLLQIYDNKLLNTDNKEALFSPYFAKNEKLVKREIKRRLSRKALHNFSAEIQTLD